MPTTVSSPLLLATVTEDLDEFDRLSRRSDVASPAGSVVGSLVSSLVNSQVGSQVGSQVSSSQRSAHAFSLSQFSDSKRSAPLTHHSAHTAPPRYRNSGAFVHGTKFQNFSSIMQQGLKAAKSEIFMIDEVRPDGRVPGLKDAPEILIFIDENKARSENMEFDYDAKLGTWKTRGIDGVIRPWFFQKVVDQRRGPGKANVLFQSKEDPMMQANKLRSLQKPRYLVHATYWQNVSGIMREGLVPAKNPVSDVRKPFRSLLQGAESHVYTLRPRGSSEMSEGLLQGHAFEKDVITKVIARDFSMDSTPEAMPEDAEAVHFLIDKDQVGLDTRPDALVVIDVEKAAKKGISLDMVQSGDKEDNIFVTGKIPPEILAGVEPNDPVNLPESLKAKIVNPKSFADIPIIDLRQDEATLIKQFKYACEEVGFMQITGHGVPEGLQQQHMALQEKFFKLDQSVKDQLRLSEASPVRGYFGRGGEDLDQVGSYQDKDGNKSRKDQKEALDCNGVPWSKPVGGYVAGVFGQQSQMPAEDLLPRFREVMEEYAAEMFKLCRRILEIMALILGKPRDFFEQHITQPVATHRILHYWPLKDFETEIGVGEHTDYGLLTILKQDLTGGLQVLNAKDGRWIHCCPIENAFVVNLGDMVSRWTAHRFKSTVHRVVNISAKDRYSVPYFLEPNMDTVIKYGGLSGKDAAGSEMHANAAKFQPPERLADSSEDTSEAILERFYRASGQLKYGPIKVRGFSETVG
mmetsp:Transcript_87265/g.154610  ORF Transcript_87265/g.154610 Transcript_87265/m.154610 type:complete len:746 (+) Transcript_87265:80-2317(+)